MAMISSAGAGKTSLAEAMLFAAGAVPHLGSIAQGTTVSDFEPEELHRRSSVSTSSAPLFLESHDYQSCRSPRRPQPARGDGHGSAGGGRRDPGGGRLVGDSKRTGQSLVSRRQRSACPVFCSSTNWIKMRHPSIGLSRCANAIWGSRHCRCRCPTATAPSLRGCWISFNNAFSLRARSMPTCQQLPIPEHERTLVADARKRIQEAVAERDDRLLEQYLAVGELTQEDLIDGLRVGVQAGTIVPLYSGSAIKNIGIVPLLNAIVDFLPSPMDRAARAPLEGLHPDTGETVSRHAVHEDPFSGIVFKTLIDPFVGRLSFLRVLSGVLHTDSMIFNSSRGAKEKSGHLYTVLGKKHTAVPSARSRGDRGDWETQRYANRRHAL